MYWKDLEPVARDPFKAPTGREFVIRELFGAVLPAITLIGVVAWFVLK